jgi:hypothetical protein
LRSLRTHVVVTLGLGALALLAGLLGALALTDIYHGEADVTLEWRIVQVSAVVILAFIVSAMVALGRALQRAGPGR